MHIFILCSIAFTIPYNIVFLSIHCEARLQLVDNINIHRFVVTNCSKNCVYLQNCYIKYQCIYIDIMLNINIHRFVATKFHELLYFQSCLT